MTGTETKIIGTDSIYTDTGREYRFAWSGEVYTWPTEPDGIARMRCDLVDVYNVHRGPVLEVYGRPSRLAQVEVWPTGRITGFFVQVTARGHRDYKSGIGISLDLTGDRFAATDALAREHWGIASYRATKLVAEVEQVLVAVDEMGTQHARES